MGRSVGLKGAYRLARLQRDDLFVRGFWFIAVGVGRSLDSVAENLSRMSGVITAYFCLLCLVMEWKCSFAVFWAIRSLVALCVELLIFRRYKCGVFVLSFRGSPPLWA